MYTLPELPASQPASQLCPKNAKFLLTTRSHCQVGSASQLASQTSHPVQSAYQLASQQASQPASLAASDPVSQPASHLPRVCSNNMQSQPSHLSQPISSASHLPRVPSFLQQHAATAKSAQRSSKPANSLARLRSFLQQHAVAAQRIS